MGVVTEKRREKRKVVYLPKYLWNLLHEDAVYQRETVTYALKQVMLAHYPAERIQLARGTGNNKFDQNEAYTTESVSEEDDVF